MHERSVPTASCQLDQRNGSALRPWASRQSDGRRATFPLHHDDDEAPAVRLARAEALVRLASHDHAVLCTLHPERGVDAVPVAYAVDDDGVVGVPIDRVKPKASMRLQRQRNLELDPRATLLAEHWDPSDWTRLWWVRAELRWEPDPGDRATSLAVQLAGRYAQYREQPFVRVLVLRIVNLTGWAANAE